MPMLQEYVLGLGSSIGREVDSRQRGNYTNLENAFNITMNRISKVRLAAIN